MIPQRPGIAVAVVALAGAAAMAWTLDADSAGDWIIVLLLSAAATATVTCQPSTAVPRAEPLVPALVLTSLNVVAGAFALRFLAPYNAVLLYGGFLLASRFVYRLAVPIVADASRRPMWVINGLITASLLLAVPMINGASVLFRYLKFPTTVGLYPDPPRGATLDEWSRARLRNSRGTRVEVALRSTAMSPHSSGVIIRLSPYRSTEFQVHSVGLSSYVGYDGKDAGKFYGRGLSEVSVTSADVPVPFTVHDDYIEIPPVDGTDVFIHVPLDLLPSSLDELPVRRRNTVSAVVHWQVGFFLFLLLTPTVRRGDRD